MARETLHLPDEPAEAVRDILRSAIEMAGGYAQLAERAAADEPDLT